MHKGVDFQSAPFYTVYRSCNKGYKIQSRERLQ
ncbi:hypothetical protein IM043_gp104 [Bacillus phage SPG24]|nr:hypothetical protein IM043_gp104 [Bacillus phage SPG24]